MCLWVLGNTRAAACEQEHGTGIPTSLQLPRTPTARGSSWSKLLVDPHSSNAIRNDRPSVGSHRVRGYQGDTATARTTLALGEKALRALTKHQPRSTSGTGKAFLTLVQLELAQKLLGFYTATNLLLYRIQQAGHVDIRHSLHQGDALVGLKH